MRPFLIILALAFAVLCFQGCHLSNTFRALRTIHQNNEEHDAWLKEYNRTNHTKK